MEGLAQRIRGLACDLCPDKPLAKKGVLQAVFLRLQQMGIIQIRVNVISLDSTCIRAHPDGMGTSKKEGASLSAEPEVVEESVFVLSGADTGPVWITGTGNETVRAGVSCPVLFDPFRPFPRMVTTWVRRKRQK